MIRRAQGEKSPPIKIMQKEKGGARGTALSACWLAWGAWPRRWLAGLFGCLVGEVAAPVIGTHDRPETFGIGRRLGHGRVEAAQARVVDDGLGIGGVIFEERAIGAVIMMGHIRVPSKWDGGVSAFLGIVLERRNVIVKKIMQ